MFNNTILPQINVACLKQIIDMISQKGNPGAEFHFFRRQFRGSFFFFQTVVSRQFVIVCHLSHRLYIAWSIETSYPFITTSAGSIGRSTSLRSPGIGYHVVAQRSIYRDTNRPTIDVSILNGLESGSARRSPSPPPPRKFLVEAPNAFKSKC